jgi:hypothetical protein
MSEVACRSGVLGRADIFSVAVLGVINGLAKRARHHAVFDE